MILSNAPFIRAPIQMRDLMQNVLLALLPAIMVRAYHYGLPVLGAFLLLPLLFGFLEAALLRWQARPVAWASDGSLAVSLWIFILAMPPLASMPLLLAGGAILFIVKHIYGGLGQNIFNPAMSAFLLLLLAFPDSFGMSPTPEGVLQATVLVRQMPVLESAFSVFLWQSALAYLVGGLYLMITRTISWYLSFWTLGVALLMSFVLHAFDLTDLDAFSHLVAGGLMLAAFFILTDPVTLAHTHRARLIQSTLFVVIALLIRIFGNQTDGIAFAIIMVNFTTPLLDIFLKTRPYGHKNK